MFRGLNECDVIFGGVDKSVTTWDRGGGVKKYRKKRDVIIERSLNTQPCLTPLRTLNQYELEPFHSMCVLCAVYIFNKNLMIVRGKFLSINFLNSLQYCTRSNAFVASNITEDVVPRLDL